MNRVVYLLVCVVFGISVTQAGILLTIDLNVNGQSQITTTTAENGNPININEHVFIQAREEGENIFLEAHLDNKVVATHGREARIALQEGPCDNQDSYIAFSVTAHLNHPYASAALLVNPDGSI